MTKEQKQGKMDSKKTCAKAWKFMVPVEMKGFYVGNLGLLMYIYIYTNLRKFW